MARSVRRVTSTVNVNVVKGRTVDAATNVCRVTTTFRGANLVNVMDWPTFVKIKRDIALTVVTTLSDIIANGQYVKAVFQSYSVLAVGGALEYLTSLVAYNMRGCCNFTSSSTDSFHFLVILP
jgi:hypothetical protein